MASWKKVLTEADVQTGTLGTSTSVVPSESSVSNAISSATTGFGTGSVTEVDASGSVNGLTLSTSPTNGITTTGTVTLGGTLTNIANSALTNSSVTIGSTAVDLGASVSTFTGLVSVTSTDFVGDLTGDVAGDLTGQVLTASQTSITSIANLATVGTIATGTWQGTAVADAYVANNLTIDGGTIDDSAIGATTPSSGAFTTLTASTSITGDLTGDVSGTATNATNVGTASVSTGSYKIALVAGAGGNEAVKYDTGLSWNAANDTLTVTNLTVAGTTTTVNSTDLAISDKLITVANGSSDAATASGAGITIDINTPTNAAGDLPRLQWNDGGAISGWTVADFDAAGSTAKPIAVMTVASGAASGTTVGQFHVNTTSSSEALYIYF